MSPFAVSDYLDAARHAGYQRFAVLLADFSDQNLLNGLSQVLRALQLFVGHVTFYNSPEVRFWNEIWSVPGPIQHRDLVFLWNSEATFDR